MNYGEKLVIFLGSLAVIAIASVISGVFVMLLWNWLMPILFGLVTIDFWEAVGVSLLCGFLFKSTSSSK